MIAGVRLLPDDTISTGDRTRPSRRISERRSSDFVEKRQSERYKLDDRSNLA